jgi:hypothetical protein
MLDELGFTLLNKVVADHIFRIVSDSYECGSIIVTSNKPFEQWGEMFADRFWRPRCSIGWFTTPTSCPSSLTATAPRTKGLR